MKESDHTFEAHEHVEITGTTLVHMDYHAVQEWLGSDHQHIEYSDFEHTFVRYGSLMSRDQRISTDRIGHFRTVGYRPPRYGRTAVFETDLCGGAVCETKGCGVGKGGMPGTDKNNSGLLFLHDALLEVINAQILNRLFLTIDVDIRCVPHLGVVDLGFDFPQKENSGMPVGTLLRAGHARPYNNNELPMAGSVEAYAKERVESILNDHGLTTSGYSTGIAACWEDGCLCIRHGGKRLDIAAEHILKFGELHSIEPPFHIFPSNVQMAKTVSCDPLYARLVDLSHYKAIVFTSGYMTTLVDDRPLNIAALAQITRRRKTPPNNEVLQYDVLTTRRNADDPRFSEINAAFPNWLDPEAHENGVVLEALKLTAGIRLGGLTAKEVANQVEEFVNICFKI